MMQIDVIHKAFEEVPVKVATVVIPDELQGNIEEALQYAYRWTQNVNGSWSNPFIENSVGLNPDWNGNVIVIEPLWVDEDGGKIGHRSTMPKDEMRVTIDGLPATKPYQVMGVGFKKVEA